MKKVLFVLLAMACVCPVYADICNSSNSFIVETICDLKECQKEIKNSVDSIGNIEKIAFEKIRKHYDTAFKDMQSSFSGFVNYIGILVTVLGFFIGALAFLNFKSANNSKEELKEESTKSRSEIERWFENQKDELRKKIEEVGNTMMNFKSDVGILFRKMVEDYYKNAAEFFNKKDFLNYFLRLEVVYIILTKIDLDSRDLLILNLSLNLVLNYKNKNVESKDIKDFVNGFLNALSNFIKYCEDTNKTEHFEIAKATEDSILSFLKTGDPL